MSESPLLAVIEHRVSALMSQIQELKGNRDYFKVWDRADRRQIDALVSQIEEVLSHAMSLNCALGRAIFGKGGSWLFRFHDPYQPQKRTCPARRKS